MLFSVAVFAGIDVLLCQRWSKRWWSTDRAVQEVESSNRTKLSKYWGTHAGILPQSGWWNCKCKDIILSQPYLWKILGVCLIITRNVSMNFRSRAYKSR